MLKILATSCKGIKLKCIVHTVVANAITIYNTQGPVFVMGKRPIIVNWSDIIYTLYDIYYTNQIVFFFQLQTGS